MAPRTTKITTAQFRTNRVTKTAYNPFEADHQPHLEIWQIPQRFDKIYGKIHKLNAPARTKVAANHQAASLRNAHFLDERGNIGMLGPGQTNTSHATGHRVMQPKTRHNIRRKPLLTAVERYVMPTHTAYRAMPYILSPDEIRASQNMARYSVNHQHPIKSRETSTSPSSIQRQPSHGVSRSSTSSDTLFSSKSIASRSEGTLTPISLHSSVIPSFSFTFYDETAQPAVLRPVGAEEDTCDVDIADYYLSVAAHGDSTWESKLQYIFLGCRDGTCDCSPGLCSVASA